MLAKRIIPCLDVCNDYVVKGIQFKSHKIVGDIIKLSQRYLEEGADELVFYDITASIDNRLVSKNWITKVSELINIPFCVAGGIKNISQAKEIFSFGADKISINSSALFEPTLISKLADRFGTQCIVVGIDSWYNCSNNCYQVFQYTGNENMACATKWSTIDWVNKVQQLGAGEIVLNIMNKDGLCNGYDLLQLKQIRECCKVPLIASGGAGSMKHFLEVFCDINVDGALAASVFHKKIINIKNLKKYLILHGVNIRLC